MKSGTVARPARVVPVPENSAYIRRREDSKRWFRNETGELECNIRWNEVGEDANSPKEFPAVKPQKNSMSTWDEAQWPAHTWYAIGVSCLFWFYSCLISRLESYRKDPGEGEVHSTLLAACFMSWCRILISLSVDG
jgi:hypothetical protein